MAKEKAEIVGFIGGAGADIPPRVALEMSSRHEFDRVIIIGQRTNGDPYLYASSGDAKEFLWDIETAKQRVLSGEYDEE